MPTLPAPGTPYYGGGQVQNPANVIKTSGAPSSKFTEDLIGTLAVDNAAGNIYGLASKAGGVDTWVLLGGSSGAVSSVLGTANQITVNTVGNVATVSLPSAITAPGSLTTTTSLSSGTTITAGTGITSTTGNIVASAGNISATLGSVAAGTSVTAGTSITATLGNITATNGNLVLSAVGNKLLINASSSATCSAGTFTLAGAATTVVSNSAVTASSLIFLQTAALGTVTAASTFAITAKSAGVSFTVTPSQSTDTSVVNYLIIN